jgi:hypothetical protein
MYNDPHCKPWTSRKWAPPGYSSRRDVAEQTRAAEAHKPYANPAGIEEGRTEKVNGHYDHKNNGQTTPTDAGTTAGRPSVAQSSFDATRPPVQHADARY